MTLVLNEQILAAPDAHQIAPMGRFLDADLCELDLNHDAPEHSVLDRAWGSLPSVFSHMASERRVTYHQYSARADDVLHVSFQVGSALTISGGVLASATYRAGSDMPERFLLSYTPPVSDKYGRYNIRINHAEVSVEAVYWKAGKWHAIEDDQLDINRLVGEALARLQETH